jgi:hypothetical protein
VRVTELTHHDEYNPGQFGPNATVEVDAHTIGAVHTTYAPKHDGHPDPGEIVWTWVPYEEHDGRGKDRPVVLVAREHTGTLLGVQLTSKYHPESGEWVSIGSGPWDHEGRDSWVNLHRVIRIHPEGMRREACSLDHERFNHVVARLVQHYNWS